MLRRDERIIPKRIAGIRFGLMDPKEIRKMSSVEVKTADTYKDDGHAYRQGLMDPHMGVIEPGLLCPTDNCKYDESPGHFGHIQLELPVVHIGFVNLIKTALKATCNSCSEILLHSDAGTHPAILELSEQDYYRQRIRDLIRKHGVGSTEFSKFIKEIEKKASEAKRVLCMHCHAQQGKIMLDKPTTFKEKMTSQGRNKETERKLNARDIREWLQGIPDDQLIFLGMHRENRPEWVILQVLPVPPITVRPSITLDSGDRSEDDLTHKLVDVLRINQRLRENRDAGAPQLIVEDLWELLQYHVTTYFDNQTSGIPPARHRSGRTLKTLTQRLKGKEGRFRSNLSGKRVNFCARSVISPDPYLGVNEVGVPKKIAKELTVPIRVTLRNREQMRQMILRGPDVHPGVNYVVDGNGRRRKINERSRLINCGFRCHNPECMEETTQRFDLHSVMPAPNFLPGLVVKKFVSKDEGAGDLVSYSIDEKATIANLRGEDIDGNPLAEDDPRAVLHHRWKFELANPDSAFPDHLQVACPHCGSPVINDWGDGDVERTLVEDKLSTVDFRSGNPKPGLQVERHLIDGDVVIFNRQPSLHRMSMMVHDVRVMEGHTFRFNLAVCTPYNADFDGDEMNLHVIQSEEARAEAKILMRVQEHIISPRNGRAIIGGIHDHISGAYLLSKPGTMISKTQGLEILSAFGYIGVLPKIHETPKGECFSGEDLLSVIIPNNIHLRFLSRSNDNVVIKEGNVSGTLDKRAIGAEDGILLDAIVRANGAAKGVAFIDDFSRLTIAASTVLGFSTGIDDYDLDSKVKREIDSITKKAISDVDKEIKKFSSSSSQYGARPGRTENQTLAENILTLLDNCKQHSGDVVKSELRHQEGNAAAIMAITGARGSMDNLAMIAGCIGQMKVRGARLERGYHQRVLPHFKQGALDAKAKGFVSSSLKTGLSPHEFFMFSIHGRESLVDTAVRVSKSGYMQRRLINAMEDLKIFDDEYRSVRNTADRIIQFSFGDDGIDTCRSVNGKSFNIDVIVDKALGTDGPTRVNETTYKDSDDKEFDLGYEEGDSEAAQGGED